MYLYIHVSELPYTYICRCNSRSNSRMKIILDRFLCVSVCVCYAGRLSVDRRNRRERKIVVAKTVFHVMDYKAYIYKYWNIYSAYLPTDTLFVHVNLYIFSDEYVLNIVPTYWNCTMNCILIYTHGMPVVMHVVPSTSIFHSIIQMIVYIKSD